MRPFPLLRRLAPILACLTLALPAAEPDRSGPRIVVQAEAYQLGDRWYCPQCRQEVPNGDRTGWDLKLSLSEWHDLLIDPAYFRDKIRAISDAELVDSLHLPAIEPALRAAVQAGDSARLAALLHEYFAGRADNGRLSLYDAAHKRYFGTGDEFRREVAEDPARAAAIRQASAALFSPATGFTIRGVRWGQRIDFNHEYEGFSRWGVHYLGFVNDLTNDYLLRRDPATAAAFSDLFEQWHDQIDRVGPPEVAPGEKSYDFIWYELGLANRTEHLINAHRVFARELSPATHLKLLKIILGSTRWLDQVDDVRAVASRDRPDVRVVRRDAGARGADQPAVDRVHAGAQQHVDARGAQPDDRGLELTREPVDVRGGPQDVVASADEAHQVGAQADRGRDLVGEDRAQQATADREVGVLEGVLARCDASLGQACGQHVGPSPQRDVGRRGAGVAVGGVPQALGERVTEGDVTVPADGWLGHVRHCAARRAGRPRAARGVPVLGAEGAHGAQVVKGAHRSDAAERVKRWTPVQIGTLDPHLEQSSKSFFYCT